MKKILFYIILMILCFLNINAINIVNVNASESLTITNVEVTSDQIESPPIQDECFIATAAYGSKYEQPVTLLRQFRDKVLLSNNIGKEFVEFYYKNSPPIANYIAGNSILRFIVKVLLFPLVVVTWLILNPVLLVILLIGIGFRVRSRKQRLFVHKI